MRLNYSPNPLHWPALAWRSTTNLTLGRAAQLIVQSTFLVLFIFILLPPMALWDAGEHVVKMYRQFRATQ